MITLYAVSILLISALFVRIVFWKKQALDAFRELAKMQGKDYLDLELATNEQILKELFKRPNNQLMLLVPEEKGHELRVNIHSMNVSLNMALTMLQRTYEGINGLSKQNTDEED